MKGLRQTCYFGHWCQVVQSLINPGSDNFDFMQFCIFPVQFFVYIVCDSVLSLSNLKLHKTQACSQKHFNPWLVYKPPFEQPGPEHYTPTAGVQFTRNAAFQTNFSMSFIGLVELSKSPFIQKLPHCTHPLHFTLPLSNQS